jgi:hypothetical protein
MTTSNDQIFEKLVDNFASIEADENKNVDEAKGKFYKHDMEVSRRESSERMQKAKAQDKIPTLAEYQILHLVDIAERGLPDCYDSFEDFLFDFWPDFSWNEEKSHPEIQAVLDDPRFKKIVPVLKETWGIDMEEDLKRGLRGESEGMDEKKKPPMCKKCGKKHWPFQKCSAKKSEVKEDAETMEEKLNVRDRVVVTWSGGIDAPDSGIVHVEKGDKGKILNVKEIKDKVSGQPHSFYTVQLDNGKKILATSDEIKKEGTTEGKSPQQGDKEATQIKKLREQIINDELKKITEMPTDNLAHILDISYEFAELIQNKMETTTREELERAEKAYRERMAE